MSTPNLLDKSYPASPRLVSAKSFHIAGILTDVYGLDELPKSCKSITCVWLLHPRNSSKQSMANMASAAITDWKQRAPADNKLGIIAVAFDQRNHGTRLVHQLANETRRHGNETHAQDMFRYFS